MNGLLFFAFLAGVIVCVFASSMAGFAKRWGLSGVLAALAFALCIAMTRAP